ncbi:MAG: ATP-binding protein [Geminicoccaceae bacterium]
MKVAFVGKGGSGKTTLAALFSRYAAEQGRHVLALDADINQHLATAIGMTPEEAASLPPMGLEIDRIKEHLRGDNPRIASTSAMIKTTPPGRGSRLLNLGVPNPIFDHFIRHKGGIDLMAVGPFDEGDIGTRCYHSKTGSVELLLSHLIDDEWSCVVVDMTAGADAFASGLFTRFDLTVLVVEPTLRSLAVYEQYRNYARDHDVAIHVMANKLDDADDRDFVRDRVGKDLIDGLSRSPFIKAMEKGRVLPLHDLEPANRAALEALLLTVGRQKKDWDRYHRDAVHFHRRNAASWANEAIGTDLTHQIDPDFSMSEAAEAVLGKQTLGAAA